MLRIAGLAAYPGPVCHQVNSYAATEMLEMENAWTLRNVALIMVGAGWEMTTADMDAYLDHVPLLLNYHAEMVMWEQESARIRMIAVRNGDGVGKNSMPAEQTA